MRHTIAPRLEARRIALFLDVDGTLLDLAPRPEAVVIPNGLVASLRGAEEALDGALALISGRSIDELDRLFSPLTLASSGVHGAQTRFANEATLPQSEGLPRSLWLALTELLFDFPGTFAENKRFSFAVHYRTAPVLKARLREGLERLVAACPELDLVVLHGHSVYELKPRGFDKGRAIERFIARRPFAGRVPVFIGDDVTDEPGFAAVTRNGGQAFSVGAERPGVTGTFAAPTDVRRFVGEIASGRAAP